MTPQAIKENIALAKSIAAETFGENPAPEVIAAVLNAITAERLNDQLKDLASDICRAAAVAAGS